LEAHTGALPAGRYRVTQEHFQQRFASTPRRQELWGHWVTATELLRSHVDICAAWIGGSYLTDKPEPGDIDCVYIVDSHSIETANDEAKRVLEAFARQDVIRQLTGLELDTFILQWEASSTPSRSHPDVRSYHEIRGYWDDLWSKMRSGQKGGEPTRLDSHPRRGYVEVLLDGFSEEGSFRTD
jgi:hypothetical protein